jgi:hypothetical protein
MPTDERLTVAQAADRLGMSEGAVRSRIKRGTLPTERERGTVYVVLGGELAGGGPAGEPPADHRLINSYAERVESLERALEAEREANRENRRIIAGLVNRVPELAAPEREAGTAEGYPVPAESPETASGAGAEEGPPEESEGPEERSSRPERGYPWWRLWGR